MKISRKRYIKLAKATIKAHPELTLHEREALMRTAVTEPCTVLSGWQIYEAGCLVGATRMRQGLRSTPTGDRRMLLVGGTFNKLLRDHLEDKADKAGKAINPYRPTVITIKEKKS